MPARNPAKEREAEKEYENPVDRAAGTTATATVWIAAFTVVMAFVGLGTLYEIVEGGSDTHDLAVAAKDQAGKMKNMSDAADKIRQAAEGMVAQEQRIADNANAALDANNRQSKAALDASVAASRVDQRAWMDMIINVPQNLSADQPFSTTAEMKNLGKTPAKNIYYGYMFESATSLKKPTFDDTRLKFIHVGTLPPQGTCHYAR
jgi:hypothetical protein